MENEKDVYRVMVSPAFHDEIEDLKSSLIVKPDEIVRKEKQDATFNIHLMRIYNYYYYKKGLTVAEFPDDFDKQVIDCANGTNTVIDSEPINIEIVFAIDLPSVAVPEKTNYRLHCLGREIQLMSSVDAVYFHWWYEATKWCNCVSSIAETCGVAIVRAEDLRSASFGLVFARFPKLRDIINGQLVIGSTYGKIRYSYPIKKAWLV